MVVDRRLLAPCQEPEARFHHAIGTGFELGSSVYPSLPQVALQWAARVHFIGLESEHDDPLVRVYVRDHVAQLTADQPAFHCLLLERPLHRSPATAVS